MKRIFLLKGLDCPNCSAKIEKEVGELDGVQSSVVNLMKQTLTINVAPTAANTIASQIETIVHSHEPDVEVQEETVMNVTKSYSLKGLDCPNCSAKIEKEVGELDGVQSSVVNLMKQTLTINVAQTAADTIASQIETIKNLILFFKIHTLTNIYVYIMLNIDKSVGSSTSSLSNYRFAFAFCKSTHFKRSASAGRLTFQGGVQHGNHAPDAPAHRQRPHGGTGHQRHHRLHRKSTKDGRRQVNYELAMR